MGEGSGPYETGKQAYNDARPVYEAMRIGATPGAMRLGNERVLTAACEAAGVELWEYDRRVVHVLSGFEPEVVQVVAGWVRRAHGGRR